MCFSIICRPLCDLVKMLAFTSKHLNAANNQLQKTETNTLRIPNCQTKREDIPCFVFRNEYITFIKIKKKASFMRKQRK